MFRWIAERNPELLDEALDAAARVIDRRPPDPLELEVNNHEEQIAVFTASHLHLRLLEQVGMFAATLATDGVSLRVLQKLLGHSSIRTTGRFAHLRPRSDEIIRGHLERLGL